MPFESFLERVNTTYPSKSLSKMNWKATFFPWKSSKSPFSDEVDLNVIKLCFGELFDPLKHLFHSSLQSGVFL